MSRVHEPSRSDQTFHLRLALRSEQDDEKTYLGGRPKPSIALKDNKKDGEAAFRVR
jgi:hypothetical protein